MWIQYLLFGFSFTGRSRVRSLQISGFWEQGIWHWTRLSSRGVSGPGRLYKGMAEAYVRVQRLLNVRFNSKSAPVSLQKVRFHGHSWGAAMALLAALDVADNHFCGFSGEVEVILWAYPRVGDATFSDAYLAKQSITIVSFSLSQDPVPQLQSNRVSGPDYHQSI